MSKNKLNLVIGLSIIFVILMISVIFGWTEGFDTFVYESIISLRCDFLDKFFKFITDLGDTLFIVGLVVGVVLVLRNSVGYLYATLAIDTVITNFIFKQLIRRDRPDVLKLIKQGGFSFPSGHSMISMSMYGMLIYLCYKKIKNKYIKWIICSLLGILILSIGLSRVYLGVHYISDVLGGFILSFIMVVLYTELINKFLGE